VSEISRILDKLDINSGSTQHRKSENVMKTHILFFAICAFALASADVVRAGLPGEDSKVRFVLEKGRNPQGSGNWVSVVNGRVQGSSSGRPTLKRTVRLEVPASFSGAPLSVRWGGNPKNPVTEVKLLKLQDLEAFADAISKANKQLENMSSKQAVEDIAALKLVVSDLFSKAQSIMENKVYNSEFPMPAHIPSGTDFRKAMSEVFDPRLIQDPNKLLERASMVHKWKGFRSYLNDLEKILTSNLGHSNLWHYMIYSDEFIPISNQDFGRFQLELLQNDQVIAIQEVPPR